MKQEQVVKLLKMLPDPSDLEGCMPNLNGKRMLTELLTNNTKKVAHITLMGILMGTVNKLMREIPDWDEYLDPSNITDPEGRMEEVPEPCGDPECEGCKQLEAAIAEAKATGATLKVMKLTKEEARKRGLIDEDGNDVVQSPSKRLLH